MIPKLWYFCSECKTRIDLKEGTRLSENKESTFHVRKDFFNLCKQCFNNLIVPIPANQYKANPKSENKKCNTCSKDILPITEYFKTGNPQTWYMLWDWDSYRAFFCEQCILPYINYLRYTNVVSQYSHINNPPQGDAIGKL